jgi:hypothetical protein
MGGPCDDVGGSDPIRLLRELGRRGRNNVKVLTTKIGGAEIVQLRSEPRSTDERHPLDGERTQAKYRRCARRRDWNGE